MSSSVHIPTELWDEVVGHFSPGVDHDTLKHLTLTNRCLHHLSRPLLFTNFKFQPYTVVISIHGMYTGDLLLPLAPELDRARQRLEFWASEAIARHVLHCDVQPLEFEESGRVPPAGEDPYTLLAAFFDFLPRFVNLQHFGGFHVHFTRATVMNLGVLQKLSSVSIDSMCLVADDEILDPPSKLLKLNVFGFANNDQGHWWFRALCPDTLRVLQMDISDLVDHSFFYKSLTRFPNVHTLNITLGRIMGSQHLTQLSKFPAVKDLTLTEWYTLVGGMTHHNPLPVPSEPGSSRVCPLLINYTGPCELLPFLPLSGMRHLTIDMCDWDTFLAAISTANNIDYLKITFGHFITSLGNLGDILPDLRILLLTIIRRRFPLLDDYGLAYSFMDDLPSSLPPNIAKLAINWEFEDAVDPPDLLKLKDAIVSQRPTLKTLWVHCADFVYVWAEMADGHQSTISGGPDVAATLLPTFEHIFYGHWRTTE
ncbi:hypothetical protein DFH09DRAFT_1371933 [Mycena vulgaris]|nr:hypothetical protein DFH09DRAFT_1371933 [Mycena vulgaris]